MKHIFALVMVALLALACTPTDTTPAPDEVPEPVAPAVPAEPETPEPETPEPETPTETEPQEIESGMDKTFGARDESKIVTLDDIVCDREAGTMEIRFRNLGEKTWSMNQEVGFPAPADMTNMRMLMNGYEVNSLRGAYKSGEWLFLEEGQKFSDACGGVEELAPGEEVTCSLTNVPFNDEDSFGDAINEVVINSAGDDGNARFACE